ncbi:MAG: hypothetical protein A2381_12080 [Bdellovibrionales bacterium RIFOXYB1_FULL_37_110]|nr:MAG: hypothetical protein A2181_01800 [Bdellovibrionales bacterium RIFOXYA1_FULL_38_20]OFZ52235.1 MAG: hypothetical protein A2417_05920 [Bdellovibrionales bacterium RIFOXYC1_FULL_37_79]OFZ56862.1 MAG: hypothetical protein A2328_08690 [Bdellovibrionales bacterium RIFOXYB2_FULL_36_6]OFZ57222.1 MAG: hypothetical protein A2381_12080 [Bdellovibrionales bacterium RIFOXYB1_FULL_37_110]OFZ65224.1 MAG: hypothetical protein A2577_04515 [Bdellovibrionales bacterium RIFOXYD1_FULL_36_51]
MKSLNGFRQLAFTSICLILTTFAVACIYSDLILTSTSYMEFSEVKFEKRLDDNYERFVASKKQISIPVIKIQKQNMKKKFSKPTLVSESKSDLTNNEENYEILIASFDVLKIKPVNKKLEKATIDSQKSEIKVKIVNNQITDIIYLYVIFDNSFRYEITSPVSVNPLSGQFSSPSSTRSNYNDGGFVNFDNNTYTLNIRFFTGILQDSLIVFKNHQTEQEIAEINNNVSPDDAYNKLIAEDEARAIEAAQPVQPLAFQTKEEAIRHRTLVSQTNNRNQEEDNDMPESESESDKSDEANEQTEAQLEKSEVEMDAVEPEHAAGFSFKANNERI